jgi:hypothetical protein
MFGEQRAVVATSSAPLAIVNVSGSEGQAYEVNVVEQTCTCRHFVHRGEICKHITAATTSIEGLAAARTHMASFASGGTVETPASSLATGSAAADSAPLAVVNVSGSEGQAYEVNVVEQTCTCGYFVHRSKICKHITAATTSIEGLAAARTHKASFASGATVETPASSLATGGAATNSAPLAVINVSGSEGQAYEVNVVEQTCTCGHFVHRGEICKHITSATTSIEGRAAARAHFARALSVDFDRGKRREKSFTAAEHQVTATQHPSAELQVIGTQHPSVELQVTGPQHPSAVVPKCDICPDGLDDDQATSHCFECDDNLCAEHSDEHGAAESKKTHSTYVLVLVWCGILAKGKE